MNTTELKAARQYYNDNTERFNQIAKKIDVEVLHDGSYVSVTEVGLEHMWDEIKRVTLTDR